MNRRLSVFCVPALVAVCLFPSAAHAAAASEQPAMLVTANRRAETIDDTLAHATLIERAEIESTGARDVLELLRRFAGVELARSGGPGQSTSLFLRGTNSNHVLVLIDGVRVASTNQGSFDFAHLPLAQIERIEIVRGPRAAWWGSDAIGGVIQIFTRVPDGVTAAVRAGSLGHAEAHAAAGGRRGDEGASFGATAGVIDIDGISAQLPGNFAFDPDRDGYRNRHVSLRGALPLGAYRLGATVLATDSDVEFDQGASAIETASGGVTLAGPAGPAWQQNLVLSYARDRLETPDFFSLFRSTRSSLDWQLARSLTGGGELVIGAQWLRDGGESIDTFSGTATFDRTRRNAAAFATWAQDFGVQRVELAIRHDDNSQFDGHTTVQAAYGIEVVDDVRLYTSWGQGFRAPNFNELYSPGFGGDFAGNPSLDPESSRSLEAGAVWQANAAHRVRVDAWRTRIEDLVAFSGPRFAAVNVGRAAIDGVELVHEWQQGSWRTRLDATWQDARDESTGLDLPRRASRHASAAANYRLNSGVEFGVAVDASGPRRDPFGTLGGYTLVHATLDWPLSRRWRLQLRGDNLTDRDYQLAAGFGQPRRTWLGTLVFTP